jgi:hypothetical protein
MRALLLALPIASACAGGATEPPGDTPPVVTDTSIDDTAFEEEEPPPPPPTPPPSDACSVPAAPGLGGVCDFSVNQARATAPTTAGAPLLLGTSQSGPNPVGGFGGPGVGNRAIAGFHGYDRLPLANFTGVAFEGELLTGSALIGPELELVVDLACDRSAYALVNVTHAHLGAPTPLADEVSRWEVLASQPKFTAVGGVTDPSTGALVVPDADFHPDVPPASLDALVANFPSACLRNADIGASALPKDTATSAVLLTLGKASTLIKNDWRIFRVEIQGDTHLPP